MSVNQVLAEINEFLGCPTPEAWLQEALKNPETLLIDHANCEKKAATTGMNLMYKYTNHDELLKKMSQLAREELDRKSTRLNSSHVRISYAVFCLKKKKKK